MDIDVSARGDSLNAKCKRIRFPLADADVAAGVAAENLWAEVVDHKQFRVDNIPFYAYGVSLDDIVYAEVVDGRLTFLNVAQYGGHSTYRIIVEGESDLLNPLIADSLEQLRTMGCTCEIAKRKLVAIDVPPATNVHNVYAILEKGEERGLWCFEEGHCGHAL